MLKGIDFMLCVGQVYVLMGGNGVGKLMLMKIIVGVEILDNGELMIGDCVFVCFNLVLVY